MTLSSPRAGAQSSARPADALKQLALDVLALRVIAAFDECGIDCLLVKGPVTQSWLYADPGKHPYGDVDLLISPDDEKRAARVLTGLGFKDHHASSLGIYTPAIERAWVSHQGVIDLHTGLTGIPVGNGQAAWRAFRGSREVFMLRGNAVDVMGVDARALHLALHAAQKLSGPKAVADLRRALDVLSTEVWRAAASLAQELGAEPALTAGLRSLPEGRELLNGLGLPGGTTTASLLQERGASSEALAIARLEGVTLRQAATLVRSWFTVTDPAVPSRRVWYLRAAAIARLPRGVAEWISANRESRLLRATAAAVVASPSSTVESPDGRESARSRAWWWRRGT